MITLAKWSDTITGFKDCYIPVADAISCYRILCVRMIRTSVVVRHNFKFECVEMIPTVNSRYSGHPWDYPKWLEYRGGRISGCLEIPAAIFEAVSRASSPACKVIVTG